MSKARNLGELSAHVDRIANSGKLTTNEEFLVKYVRLLQHKVEAQWLMDDLVDTLRREDTETF